MSLFDCVNFCGCLSFFVDYLEYILECYFEVVLVCEQVDCFLVLVGFIVVEEVSKNRFELSFSIVCHEIASE